MSAAAQAQPNIALIKYWGKRDARLNLPAVGSISITLDRLWTRTCVRFDPQLAVDQVQLDGRTDAGGATRVCACLDLLRRRAGIDLRARVESWNNFPTGAGLASSASGFAALVTAADAALGLGMSPAECSALARQGSGSAARSIFGGFVEWHRGQRPDGGDSVAEPLLAAADWPLSVLVAITSRAIKSVGSTEGMNRTAASSPYWTAWLQAQMADLAQARAAIAGRDFERLAEVAEHSCLKMHALALAARPGLVYWNGATVEALHAVRALRAGGVPVFFTNDAGPQLKAICLPSAAERVARTLHAVPGVLEVVAAGLGEGARLIGADQVGAARAGAV
ncbi:MAG: diphosphomevalonate decarboxylase [Gammaproteobacteria bacterium]|nr:diphosphomevalonate decarboxylase [Gammaproteobacteria bacterium]